MATIRFKTKIRGVEEESYIVIPAIKRGHCNMPEMRDHPIIGMYANSELFFSALRKCLEKNGIKYGNIKLTEMPECMRIIDRGFLTTIEIYV